MTKICHLLNLVVENTEQIRFKTLPMNAMQTMLSIVSVLSPFLAETNFKDNIVIMDNAAPHTVKSVQEFMKSQGIEYVHFGGGTQPIEYGFPPNSPDLNPIENIFGTLQARVDVEKPRTENELIKVVEKCWKEIPMSHVRSTIRSIKKRMKFIAINI